MLRIKKEKDMRDVARPSFLIFLFHPRKLNGTTKYQKDREADLKNSFTAATLTFSINECISRTHKPRVYSEIVISTKAAI